MLCNESMLHIYGDKWKYNMLIPLIIVMLIKLFYVQNFKIKSDLIQKMGEYRLVTRFIKQTSCAVLILYKYSTYFDWVSDISYLHIFTFSMIS